MTFQLYALPAPGRLFTLPSDLFGWAVLAALIILVGLLLWLDGKQLMNVTGAEFGAALVAGALLPCLCVVSLGEPGPSISLMYLAGVLWAAWRLGRAPALLVGLVSGTSSALAVSGHLTDVFAAGLFGIAAAVLLQQRYSREVADAARQPLAAALVVGGLVLWPLKLLGVYLANAAQPITAVEQALAQADSLLLLIGLCAVIAGGLMQAAAAWYPALAPNVAAEVVPPWRRKLWQRALFTATPLIALAVILLTSAVTWVAYQVATRLVVDEMSQDAANAGSSIPLFIQVGQGLIRDLAAGSAARPPSPADLAEGLRAVPFFQQLIYTQGDTLTAYPAENAALTTAEEERVILALASGIPGEVLIHDLLPEGAVLSFIVPVSGGDGSPQGALVGRAALNTNPILLPTLNLLDQGAAGGQGQGAVLDAEGRLLLAPASFSPEDLSLLEGGPPLLPAGRRYPGQTYRALQADGTRLLLHRQPIEGRSDWSVVITAPNETVGTLALQIALPTLLVLLLLTAGGGTLLVYAVRHATRPLEELLIAVKRLGAGQLDQPLRIQGEDEIGQLGAGFEEMRGRLKARLAEQERLLNVSRSVASSLELYRAMPTILSNALDSTGAVGVRIILRRPDRSLQNYAAGEAAAGMAILDEQIIDLVERQGTVVISQLERAALSLHIKSPWLRLGALAAFPLRGERVFLGVMWLAYSHEHTFDQAELTFLSTLAEQASLAVANARLYAAAEEGRQKLQAVLESTPDGMIVTDQSGRIVLMNPTAERYFGLESNLATGLPPSQVLDVPQLAEIMTDLRQPVATLELTGRNGRVVLANTSTIINNGAITGRVAVLRDITALKELDNIKTVFLRMVSHDLRSPLTFMRGYISMMALLGDLNEKQRETLTKIDSGIDYINEMTERLTYLSKLRFGEGVELDYAMIDLVDVAQNVLHQLDMSLRDADLRADLEVEPGLPLVPADFMLLRQAVLNLVNNAIKYTLPGGQVTIRLCRGEGEMVEINVEDTGIGIRQEDMARLFDAFYRVPQREGDVLRPRGSGLGLALVKAIADAHGGRASAKSVFGQGSTFALSLPLTGPDGAGMP